MAPNLISSYSKDLSKKPSYVSKSVIDEYHHLSLEDDDLLKIIEYALVGSEYHFYSDIIYMGCTTPGFYSEHAEHLRGTNIALTKSLMSYSLLICTNH
ncbi:hypothetical protein Xind_03640 [Xenorhabdus indica]|nr:hypothetical protein [Xenorhabdus indica]